MCMLGAVSNKAHSEELSSAPRGPPASSFQWEHTGCCVEAPQSAGSVGLFVENVGGHLGHHPHAAHPHQSPLQSHLGVFRGIKLWLSVTKENDLFLGLQPEHSETLRGHLFLAPTLTKPKGSKKRDRQSPSCLLGHGATYVASKRCAEGNEG